MRLLAQLSVLLPLALSWCSVSASNAHQVHRRHVKRLDSDLTVRASGDVDMYKRDYPNSRFTYYADGLGACGSTNQPGDYIVALNSAQYQGGQNCYQTITITIGGLTTQAQIVDECPGCPFGGLDFSEGLFQFFAPLSSGVLYGTWSFGSAPAPAPAPSPTSTYQAPILPTIVWQSPTPTTTWTPPPPSTTPSPSPTPSSTSATITSSSSSSFSTSTTSSSSSSSASSSASSTTTANSVVESAGVVPASTGNAVLMNLNLAMVYLGEFLGVAQT
ncbi:RlpA-like double-psi beta-barrel-protein domain-containing protein-containing protein [Suillus clintonianus]|uniref:RlpA-like double-psi beta-barrel-protein domain-containing protein-containing protein n=1 Tax=Suillus clintonianus TaxID=1904413 RepID=UPI001B8775BA|nr:RlpA-like double-psi beta-barrel-protein domain-containing protein-containing protein [Suillus clintonianus]KAG2157421.1 RlpA-like double-psi beta-barrel-protein domain-containing protein-containing protein [Suillus clintonianus]